MVMMLEQPMAILQQIPDDDNVDDQDAEHRKRKLVDQLVNLNGDEEH